MEAATDWLRVVLRAGSHSQHHCESLCTTPVLAVSDSARLVKAAVAHGPEQRQNTLWLVKARLNVHTAQCTHSRNVHTAKLGTAPARQLEELSADAAAVLQQGPGAAKNKEWLCVVRYITQSLPFLWGLALTKFAIFYSIGSVLSVAR